MLAAVGGARRRYEKDLKSKSDADLIDLKRKHEDEIRVLSAKIKRFLEESLHLSSLANDKAKATEQKSCLKTIAESNALRDASSKKEAEAGVAEAHLAQLKSMIKSKC